MAHFLRSRSVLAVRDLDVSTKYFSDILGFNIDETSAPGWSFLSRDSVRLMVGYCPEVIPASQLGDHNWFAHILVDDVDAYHDEVVSRGAEVLSALETKPWGIRDFSVRTPDGHRITFGQVVE